MKRRKIGKFFLDQLEIYLMDLIPNNSITSHIFYSSISLVDSSPWFFFDVPGKEVIVLSLIYHVIRMQILFQKLLIGL